MKTVVSIFLTFVCAIGIFTSCEKMDDGVKTTCEFTSEVVTVEPVCNFNPKTLTDVPFPVYALHNGQQLNVENYTFSYSTNPDFGGSAISVTYDQLPLTITVTEKATDCEATVTLEKSYWD